MVSADGSVVAEVSGGGVGTGASVVVADSVDSTVVTGAAGSVVSMTDGDRRDRGRARPAEPDATVITNTAEAAAPTSRSRRQASPELTPQTPLRVSPTHDRHVTGFGPVPSDRTTPDDDDGASAPEANTVDRG